MIRHWYYVSQHRDKYEVCYNDYDYYCEEFMYEGDYVKDWVKEGVFEYKGVYSCGGEGEGSDFYSVIVIRNHDNHDEKYYIKFQGWYASYSGAEYDNWSFVEPKQKTITVYS